MKTKTFKRYGANAIEVDGVLVSYDTPVCEIRDGEFVRLWGGWSATTMRHVNEFREWHGMPGITKAEWKKLEVES